MRKVAPPIISSETTSSFLRPSRSPKCPNPSAPTGRAKKPTAYGAKAASVAAKASCWGKKSGAKTRAAGEPYRKKSYHSTVVAMKMAPTTRPKRAPEEAGADMGGGLLVGG